MAWFAVGTAAMMLAVMAPVLKSLDAGYGYSADGGRTFPFRGKGVGAIPTLAEAVRALPTTPA